MVVPYSREKGKKWYVNPSINLIFYLGHTITPLVSVTFRSSRQFSEKPKRARILHRAPSSDVKSAFKSAEVVTQDVRRA